MNPIRAWPSMPLSATNGLRLSFVEQPAAFITLKAAFIPFFFSCWDGGLSSQRIRAAYVCLVVATTQRESSHSGARRPPWLTFKGN
jgi:hypothetical protein